MTRPRYVPAKEAGLPRPNHNSPSQSGNYALSTNPALTSPNDTGQPVPYSLFPRDDLPAPVGVPHEQTDTEQPSVRTRSNERGKYHEDHHPSGQVTTTIGNSRRATPARSLSGTQNSVSHSGSNRVGTSAQPSSCLSRLGQEFIKIEYGQYSTCKVFIEDHPDILHEKLNDFQLEAVRLEREGRFSMVRTCVQQLLLLRGCLSKSDEGHEPFLSRMKNGDKETLKSFLLDFDKTLKALRAKAADAGPLLLVKSAEPEPVRSTSRGLSGIPQGRHAPETIRRDSNDSALSESARALSIGSRHDPERSGSHGQAGKKPIIPPAGRTATHRRSTLGSVDENASLDVQSDTNSQAGDVSIVDAKDLDIRGSAGEREELDHRYQRRNDAKKYFVVGRVFAMLWHEGAGDKKGGHLSQVGPYKVSKYSTKKGKYNEDVFSHIRRMVVVRARHGYCWCVPINTYNFQGVAKKGLSDEDREAHSIIYMDDTKPAISSTEKGMMFKDPVAVTAASAEQKLHRMSRVNFGKVYSVEWNVKVMPVGKVNERSMAAFTGYWYNEATRP